MSRRQIWQFDLESEAGTIALGAELAMDLRIGDCLILKGDLGTGKTTLARAIIRALGRPDEEVPSPSFTLVQSYEDLRIPVWHFDLYRLNTAREIFELGFEEAEETGASLIEWPQIMAAYLPPDYLEIELEDAKNKRRVRLTGHGAWAPRLKRIRALNGFLRDAGWQNARRSWMQGDASGRSYEKLQTGVKTAVLMNAPPHDDGPPVRDGKSYGKLAHLARDMTPFCAIAAYLRNIGLSAPQILAADLSQGFLLLEDLGDEVYASRLAQGKAMDAPYEMALKALCILHERRVPEYLPLNDGGSYRLPEYDNQAFEIEAELLLDWYWPHVNTRPLAAHIRQDYLNCWRASLAKLSTKKTLVLRDYHSPNLIWLEARAGAARAGIIDFQDAVTGPPAYDLVSLLQDARVDVPRAREAALRQAYIKNANLEGEAQDAFWRDYALMGAQRAAKILGIFVRLARRDGKTEYLKHLPRVEACLARNLAHEALAPVERWFKINMPMLISRPQTVCGPIDTAMILAAGLGTRMGHLSAKRPKPLVEVNGIALIDHVLARLRDAHISHIVVNLHYRADQLRRHLERKNMPHLQFSDERGALLDTGGGVKKALSQLGAGAFFILNTDSIWREGEETNLERLRRMWSDQAMDFLLLLAPAHGSLGYDGPGDFHLRADGRIQRRAKGETAKYAHTGICIAHPRAFADCPEGAFSLNLLWDRASGAGRLYGLALEGEWMHVGTPQSVAAAEKKLQEPGA